MNDFKIEIVDPYSVFENAFKDITLEDLINDELLSSILEKNTNIWNWKDTMRKTTNQNWEIGYWGSVELDKKGIENGLSCRIIESIATPSRKGGTRSDKRANRFARKPTRKFRILDAP